MKAHLLLAMVAAGALALPAAAAHILIHAPVYDPLVVPPRLLYCVIIVVGSPSSPPHAAMWIDPCPPIVHPPPLP